MTSAVASGAGSLVAAAYFARRVLTPDRQRPDDVVVRAAAAHTVTLTATPETIVPGRYGLWIDNGFGHVRVGDIMRVDATRGTVERELLAVDRGYLAPGPARWNAYFHGSPPDVSIGARTEHVTYAGELGAMPAWVVRPQAGTDDVGRWAVLVHGRGARREETIRAMPPLLAHGWTCLVPSYRNDEGVPAGPDSRYNLGLSEWRDIEAALRHAVAHGAREVLLVGWSMGGAIALQLLDRSSLAGLVSRVVLDGPVIDWGDVLAHHARGHRLPRHVGSLARVMMRQRWGHRLVGVREGVDLAKTDWVSRADELHHRILLIHSVDDEFVPVGPSRELARVRPDLVTFEEWTVARHCTEWNTDPERWERLVADFAAG
ncbi:alpha/beta hydrolase family protein [Fodinibacter luteus]|uniref:alpha/beta hydrolase family protein n=1 Tax=Fodinibacter luteus TaxID=552064 RepID=UPI0031E60735